MKDIGSDRTYEDLKHHHIGRNIDRWTVMFWSYLWGFETNHGKRPLNQRSFSVLIVPMRIWNESPDQTDWDEGYRVLIVPMRIWNARRRAWASSGRRTSSDRTYEDLKQSIGLLEKYSVCPEVLIVPMRIWNFHGWIFPPVSRMFWSYLWGFETAEMRDVKGANTRFWSYLWGFETSSPSLTWSSSMIPFWSYLWGFETRSCVFPLGSSLRSDRTYEDLKLNHNIPVASVPGPFWSYLWGFETSSAVTPISWRMSVLIVPMRIWNMFVLSEKYTVTFGVLIVPMRIWNFSTAASVCRTHRTSSDRTYEDLKLESSTLWFPMAIRFWSYLWGFETRFAVDNGPGSNLKFWSYLWGFETPSRTKNRRRIRIEFWSYLWGFETGQIGVDQMNDLIEVLIVPMRIWNSIPTYFPPSFTRYSSDRTYEDLKPIKRGHGSGMLATCSDRTYEDLKPDICNVLDFLGIRFWSYLWGFETEVKNDEQQQTEAEFWSYLWGFETRPIRSRW